MKDKLFNIFFVSALTVLTFIVAYQLVKGIAYIFSDYNSISVEVAEIADNIFK